MPATFSLVMDPVAPGQTPELPDAVFRGKDALRELLEVYLPGLELVPTEGDKVAARITGRYVHKGVFPGIAPTGKAVVLPRMAIFGIWGGRVVEHWDQADRLGLLQELGVVPANPAWTSSPGYDGFR